LKQRLGYRPPCMHQDDGVLIRLTESDEPLLDLFEGITPDNVHERVLEELADSALFALRFRQNAARALMMPRGNANRRAPLWLQRLRGRDLLQVARRHPDFPIVAETFRECLHDHLDLPRLQEWLADLHAGRIEVRTLRLEAPTPFAATLLFSFTMGYMYQYDEVERDAANGASALNPELLEQLVAGSDQLALNAQAVQQVDRRLRGVGRPPRSAAEMAEWLRRVGDVSASELEGQMPAFLRDLEADGRALKLALGPVAEPDRWVLTDEAARYRVAFGISAEPAEEADAAAAAILLRYLETRALVGLEDVLRHYPFERTWALRKLEEWAQSGRLVRVPAPAAPDPLQFSLPDNLDQVRRGTLAIQRREVITCPAPQFADFVARWQYAHPSARRHGADGLAEILTRLHALPLPLSLWEQTVLPNRMHNYDPRWLDELTAGGAWTWSMLGEEALAFFERDTIAQLQAPVADPTLDPSAEACSNLLQQRGASYASEIADQIRAPEVSVRSALWSLLRLGLATNDRFDVLRRGEPLSDAEQPFRSRREVTSFLKRSSRERLRSVPEGRWSLLPWGQPDIEASSVACAARLLTRYGVVARELAALDPAAPVWRILYEVYSRMELAGDVRRGYFVEGLSGAQFALPDAARHLQELSLPAQAAPPLMLLHSLDPANLYGSGAPFELIAGADRTFLRRAGNWLVQGAGKPVLLIEQQGKRLTTLPNAGMEQLTPAVKLLPSIMSGTQSRDIRHKLVIETWNEQPVTTTPGKELLEQAGFVRDYQAMTLYAAWQ
jgi:ATP-dependent Lhr-like helicase